MEFDSCETKSVWKIIKKSNLPKGRKIIGNHLVFSQKDDGRYRARTVAKGFSQIAGKDFQENHAQVVHDTTFHMILVIKIMCKLSSRHFDIETAFLYGTLEEEICMMFPDGYERYLQDKGLNYSSQEYLLLLTKALYMVWFKQRANGGKRLPKCLLNLISSNHKLIHVFL